MKNNRILLIIIGLFAALVIQAQAPEKIDFQAMARDASGNPLIDQNIGVQISIKQGNMTGSIIYQEEVTTSTNSHGVFSLAIGEGNPVSGTFADIDWTSGDFFCQVEVDPDGGTNYTDMGTMELMSVPFALYANRAGYGEDDDADTLNELQNLSVTGNELSITSGNSVTLPSSVWEQSDNDISFVGGNVGIGTDSPERTLDIVGPAQGQAPNIRTFGDMHVGNGTINGGAIFFGIDGYSWIYGDYIRQWDPGRMDIVAGGTENGVRFSIDSSEFGAKVFHKEDAWFRISADDNNSGGDDGTQNAYLQFTTDGGNEDYDGLIWLENLSGDTKLHFDVEDQETMVMHDGNVGIGTTSPLDKLSVAGNFCVQNILNTKFLKFRTSGSSLDLDFGDADLFINAFDNGLQNYAMRIDYTTGNVGIGIGNPEAKLDVNGDVKIGENGMHISEILELTGTITSYNSTEISYPTGYDLNNTRVLSLDIQNDFSNWVSMGYSVPGIDRSIACVLLDDKMILTTPEIHWFLNKPYRITLMKVE